MQSGPMVATDLRAAVRVLDPARTLQTADDINAYFVARPASPVGQVRVLLEDMAEAGSPQKFLFTGHRGNGKSTELAKLRQDLIQDFFFVNYSVQSTLGLADVTYLDVLLRLGIELVDRALALNIDIDADILAHVLEFARDITKDVELGGTAGAEVGPELNLLVGKLSGKIKAEITTRVTVRAAVSHRVSDLITSIDLISRQVTEKTGRPVLAIIEDLDKLDTGVTREMFCEYATSLNAPALSIIYTFPVELRYDNDFPQIRANFPNVYTLPNIRTRARDGTLDPIGLGLMQTILRRRVEPALFSPEALETLAALGCGIPRELIAIARQACLEARVAARSRIELVDVERAAATRRAEYQVLLTSRQRALLRRVHQTKEIENDGEHRDLLRNLSMLEYDDGGAIWHDVHPVVLSLLADGT